jgi:septum formation protein
MIRTEIPIYLASKSPRRQKLLKQLNLKFKVIHSDIDEKIKKRETPVTSVKRLAKEKLENVKKKIGEKGIIISADTIVVLDNHIIGKPKDEPDAERILKKLSGKTHYVFTGFSVHNSVVNKTVTGFEKTAVTFRSLNKNEIKEYITLGSPMDKAGAYGIQDDFGAVFIKKINGCYYNVVGLPLSKVYDALLKVI